MADEGLVLYRLSEDDLALIDEALQMLSCYVVADVSTTDEILDDVLNDESGIQVSVSDYQTISKVFEDGKAKSDAIEQLRRRLARKGGV